MVTAGVMTAGTDGDIDMEDDAVYTTPKKSITQWQQL